MECALRDVAAPIGVARYRLLPADALPAALAKALPSAKDFSAGILTREEFSDHQTLSTNHTRSGNREVRKA